MRAVVSLRPETSRGHPRRQHVHTRLGTCLVTGPRIGSLCSGYGGLDLAVMDVLGGQVVAHAETDAAASSVLAHHWPATPNLGDITAIDWAPWVGEVDVLTAGFPCTDISSAGRRAGLGAGTRSGIWAHVARAIDALRPALVVVENVEALLSTAARRSGDGQRGADSGVEPGPADVGDNAGGPALTAAGAVLGDLADLGYDASWVTVPASGVGACHRRRRVFIIAWPAVLDAGRDRVRQQPVTEPRRGGAALPSRCAAQLAADSNGSSSTGWERVPGWGQGGGKAPVGVGAGHDGLSLLPTPTARLGDGSGMPGEGCAAQRNAAGRRNLEDAVALLPTPAARDAGRGAGYGSTPGRPLSEAIVDLLPTPRATDGTKGGPNQRGSSGDLMLPSAVAMLPTPRATRGGSGTETVDLLPTPRSVFRTSRGAVLKHSSHPSLEQAVEISQGEMPRELTSWDEAPDSWQPASTGGISEDALFAAPKQVAAASLFGKYTAAITRHERALGRPAPAPTITGARGGKKLNPAFVEWMMMLPPGHVTAVPGVTVNEMLAMLGNGVVPAQAAAALRFLLTREAVSGS